MDDQRFDRFTKQLIARSSRRRAVTTLAGGMLGAALGLRGVDDAAARRCRKRLQPCTRRSQCCGQNVRCATSHGAGDNTCCGARGATCTSDLTCCAPLLCNADNRCAEP